MVSEFVPCRELQVIDGGDISIKQLKKVIDEVSRKYGENSILRFDAGHNNIRAEIKRDC